MSTFIVSLMHYLYNYCMESLMKWNYYLVQLYSREKFVFTSFKSKFGLVWNCAFTAIVNLVWLLLFSMNSQVMFKDN